MTEIPRCPVHGPYTDYCSGCLAERAGRMTVEEREPFDETPTLADITARLIFDDPPKRRRPRK